MRIVLDMQGAQSESRFRGIGRFITSFTKALVSIDREDEIILTLNGLFPEAIAAIRREFQSKIPQENIRVWHSPDYRNAGTEKEINEQTAQILYTGFIRNLNPDVVYLPSFFEMGSLIPQMEEKDYLSVPIIYDFIPLKFAEKYLIEGSPYKKFYLKRINQLKKVDGGTCISEYTLNDAAALVNIPTAKLVNIYAACGPEFSIRAEQQECLACFNICKPFILFTGGGDSRKNLTRLIEAFSLLPAEIKQAYQLVIAGKMPPSTIEELRSILSFYKVSDDCVLTGFVSDRQLIELYNLCSLFVFPSLYEGFGLPLLEAIHCGAPVIASNATSIPEVLGCNDALFDPYDVNDIAKKIESGLTDNEFIKRIKEEESSHSAKLSWELTAKRALDFFKTLNEGHQKTKAASISEGESSLSSVSAVIDSLSQLPDIHVYKEKELKNLASMIALNFPVSRGKTLFVDISELINKDAGTGIQRVTRSIISELIAHPPKGYSICPVFATATEPGYKYVEVKEYPGKKLPFAKTEKGIDFQNGDILLVLDLQHQVAIFQHECGCLPLMQNQGVLIYFVVYDLLPIYFPYYFAAGEAMKFCHSQWLKVVTQYYGSVSISKAVSTELHEWIKENFKERLDFHQINWFHLGADIQNSVPSKGMPGDADKCLSMFHLAPTFLMVGTIEPRKKHALVLSAFEYLWNQGVNANLVFVGKQGWRMDDLCERMNQNKYKGNKLFWLSGISDEYLEKIYSASTCLIMASEGEGFGLPLIEAAQHKLPIIARDIPVFREVAGNHAFYFSGSTGEGLADAIKEWLKLYKAGTYPKSDDMPWLTWKESAQMLLKAIGIPYEGDDVDA